MKGPEGTFYEYRKFATQALRVLNLPVKKKKEKEKYDQNLILCAVNNITRSTVPSILMCHKSKENLSVSVRSQQVSKTNLMHQILQIYYKKGRNSV